MSDDEPWKHMTQEEIDDNLAKRFLPWYKYIFWKIRRSLGW